MSKQYPNLTFIDTETTGLNPVKDKIIEIAAIRVENGKVVKILNTLLNPEISLPYYIKNITGIEGEMLENKPTFYNVKDELRELFKDSIFVSHNSHFDYGFIREEFRRHDETFKIKHLCTVRMFKKLYPRVHRHNLDSLINHFGFECENRHRAYGDCKVLVDFYDKVVTINGLEFINNTIHTIITKQSIPPKIVIDDVEKLPEVPGVYIFYSKDDIPLYVGKSINIKERVQSHFSNIGGVTDLKIVKELYKIKHIETAGEFGALVLENRMIKELSPVYNKKQRRVKKLIAVTVSENSDHYSSVNITDFEKVNLENIENVIGIFKNIKQAKEFVIKKASENKICLKILGLDKSSGACFNYHLQKCDGACIGKENHLKHNIKFIMAFTNSKFKNWPYKGPKIIKEQNKNGLTEFHVINNWRYLGKVENEGTYPDKLPDGAFDLDEYKILTKFLLKST